jgi:CheY-like chemotaxis protein/anti-sigma regulatory factor (Ser/Thr protein kinase)
VSTLRTGEQLHGRNVLVKAEEAVWIYADASRIEQVICNLLVNAVKYSGADASIQIQVRRDGELAVLSVRDEGIGIDADLLPKVFDLFVQGARTLDRAQGGLGIGLTLVRRVVELHGGSVRAESAGAGAGSLFTIKLPAIDAPAVIQPAPLANAHTPRKVLIVEDNEDARVTMRMLLADIHGHHVSEAADGPEGVRKAIEQRPEIAFIDLGLPGFDGYEVARQIRAVVGSNSMRLVALTGYGGDEDYKRTAAAGFDLHLVKPVDIETLERVFRDSAPDLHQKRAGGTR